MPTLPANLDDATRAELRELSRLDAQTILTRDEWQRWEDLRHKYRDLSCRRISDMGNIGELAAKAAEVNA